MQKSTKLKIIIAIVCISFVQGLQFFPSPVLGQIQAHYPEQSVNMIQMLITAPTFLSMVMALISGVLVMKVSKRKQLLFACAVAAIVGFLPLVSDSFLLLFICRIFYGIPMGLCTALNAAVVAEFFTGDEKMQVMGIQGASVGCGMVIITGLAGILGAYGFRMSYYVNVIALIAMALIALCLPDTGTAAGSQGGAIKLNKDVFIIALFGVLETLFLITFTTNIAMHIQGELAGSTEDSGTLTAVFSGAQIVIGLLLGVVSRVTKKYTMGAAMLSFSVGLVFLILFPSNLVMLMIGATFCGFSQGIFIPTGNVEATNAVDPVSAAMAASIFTCGLCLGQFISPVVVNAAAGSILGEVSTTNVYITALVGMTLSGLAALLWKKTKKCYRKEYIP